MLFRSCPDEAVCVQFFPGLENAANCLTNGNPNQDLCPSSEFCTVGGQCAPRSIEQRFCMLTCDSKSDCRDGYECRGREGTNNLQSEHGGEPVPDPTAGTAEAPKTKFCGPERACAVNTDCTGNQTCDPRTHVCVG